MSNLKKKKTIKKLIKNNGYNLITIFIASISLIVSIISLNDTLSQSKISLLPNIMLKSISNDILAYKIRDEYQTAYNEYDVNLKMPVVNIGNGVAKNLSFSFSSENLEEIEAFIQFLDKDEKVEIVEESHGVSWKMPRSSGYFSVSSKNYSKNIDYLLSEKDEKSTQNLNIPFEYMMYMEILLYLCLTYDYDINEVMNRINLYVELEYQDIENEIYKKTIPIKIRYNKEKDKIGNHYFIDFYVE